MYVHVNIKKYEYIALFVLQRDRCRLPCSGFIVLPIVAIPMEIMLLRAWGMNTKSIKSNINFSFTGKFKSVRIFIESNVAFIAAVHQKIFIKVANLSCARIFCCMVLLDVNQK